MNKENVAIHIRMFEVSFQLSEFSKQFQDGGFKSKILLM